MCETENTTPQWKRAALTMEPTKGPSPSENLPPDENWWLRLVEEARARWLRENPW